MQRFSVHIPHFIRKNLVKIPIPWRTRLWQALDTLEYNPFYGMKMLGQYKDKYKIRVWPYRIIYRVKKSDRVVEILELDHRGSVSYN
jgi:mRNA-degrading endonuclease RelE of RelBE toxin-antitoxin system